jgi:hypothetical protein
MIRSVNGACTQNRIEDSALRGRRVTTSTIQAKNGAPGWSRTNDTGIFSPLLYHLSYGRIFMVAYLGLDQVSFNDLATILAAKNISHT